MEGYEETMKDSEKEEASHWLEKLTGLYEKNRVAITEVASLNTESSSKDWDKAFSNENAAALMNAIEPIKELPKPKNKELRKLKDCYRDLASTCLKAGHLYLKSYYAGDLSRLRCSQMIFWTAASEDLLKDFQKNLEKVRQEIESNK